MSLVIRALRESRRLFAGYADPARLELRQLRAQGMQSLNRVLSQLAERTGALWRLEQAAANREALHVLHRVREAARGPFATPGDKERAEAMIAAEGTLAGWRERTAGVRRR